MLVVVFKGLLLIYAPMWSPNITHQVTNVTAAIVYSKFEILGAFMLKSRFVLISCRMYTTSNKLCLEFVLSSLTCVILYFR